MFTREAFVFETTVNAVWKLVCNPEGKLGSASAVIETLACITGIFSNVTLSTGSKVHLSSLIMRLCCLF